MKKKEIALCDKMLPRVYYNFWLDLLDAKAASDTDVQNEDVLKCVSNLEDEAASSWKPEDNG